jgi:hypothetical protein
LYGWFIINSYTQINTNWLHGVQIQYGSGWSGISGQVGSPVVGGSGAWTWFNSCTSTANGSVFGQGFYIDLDGDGNPGNNFGDNCGSASNQPCPAGTTWTFCFNLTVATACNPGSNLSVTINTSGDGESGSWNNAGCVGDAATVFNATGSCCPPTMTQVPATCAGNDGQATATPVGTAGPYNWVWSGPAGYSNTQNNVAGASTITGLTPGTYTIVVTDNNSCAVTNTISVTGGGANPAPVAGSNSPVCVGQTINLTCNNIVGATYNWSGPNGFTANNTQNPTVPGATAVNSGVYTVTVTVAGCTATATTNVLVNPAPVPTAANTGPYCQGATISLSATPAGATYSWSGPAGFLSANQNPTIATSAPAMSGVYTVTVSIGTCSATATTSVVVNPSPVPVINSNTPVCLNQTINLSSTAGFTSYVWAGPNAFASALQNPSITPATCC